MAGGGRAWLSTAMSDPQSNVSHPRKPGLLGTPPPYVHLSRRLAAQGARATQPMLASKAGALGAGPHRSVLKEPISTARGASGPQGGTRTSPGRTQLWHLQAWCTARTGERSSFLARTPACHLLGCSLFDVMLLGTGMPLGPAQTLRDRQAPARPHPPHAAMAKTAGALGRPCRAQLGAARSSQRLHMPHRPVKRLSHQLQDIEKLPTASAEHKGSTMGLQNPASSAPPLPRAPVPTYHPPPQGIRVAAKLHLARLVHGVLLCQVHEVGGEDEAQEADIQGGDELLGAEQAEGASA